MFYGVFWLLRMLFWLFRRMYRMWFRMCKFLLRVQFFLFRRLFRMWRLFYIMLCELFIRLRHLMRKPVLWRCIGASNDLLN